MLHRAQDWAAPSIQWIVFHFSLPLPSSKGWKISLPFDWNRRQYVWPQQIIAPNGAGTHTPVGKKKKHRAHTGQNKFANKHSTHFPKKVKANERNWRTVRNASGMRGMGKEKRPPKIIPIQFIPTQSVQQFTRSTAAHRPGKPFAVSVFLGKIDPSRPLRLDGRTALPNGE